MSFNIVKFLESIFPFLFSALKRSWDNLSPAQQQALVQSGTIGQYLKNNLTAVGDDLASLISNDLNLPKDTVEATLIALAAKFGLDTTSVNDAVAFLQKKLQSVSSNEEWNGLLSTILNVGATILSGGAIDWVHVALGLGEWVYQQFIAPKQVTVLQAQAAVAASPSSLVGGIGTAVSNIQEQPIPNV